MGLFSRGKPPERGVTDSARRDLVVPMLSGQAWIDANAETFAQIPDFPAGSYPLARPIAEGLYVTYAIDPGPGPSWEVVSVDAAHAYGDEAELHTMALANLRRRGNLRVEGDSGRYRLTIPSELDLSGSIILDPQRWRATFPIKGDLVVAIPTRIETLICSANDAESVASLATLAAKAFDAADGKPVSPSLYRMSPDGLATFR